MTSSGTSSVICQEVFDDGYQPSSDEINEYAIKIGIDPAKEPHLLYLAKEGLVQALPSDWKICYNDQLHAHYYYNIRTKASQWDHPLDAIYREFAEQARQRQLGGTPAIDNSEDASQVDSGIRSLQGNEEFDTNNTNDTITVFSSIQSRMANFNERKVNDGPISNNSSTGGFSGGVSRFLESRGKSFTTPSFNAIKNSRFEVVKTNPQIGLAMRLNDAAQNANLNSKKQSTVCEEKKGFTLSGTGSMFLKSNTNSKRAMIDFNTDKSNEVDEREKSDNLLTMDTPNVTVRGILRDSSLTDVRHRKFEDGDGTEDKKSVRFNLDDIKTKINYSPEDDPSSSKSKFTQSPDVSDNSDDDDPWDFGMDDDHDNEIYIRDIKVVPIPKKQSLNLLKPLLRAEIIKTDDTFTIPSTKVLEKLGKFSVSSKTMATDSNSNSEKSAMLDKLKERNVVRPLYEDTDSDSRGSSVRSFIQKTEINKISELSLRQNQDLEQLKLKMKREFDIEESQLREEMKRALEEKKELFLKQNEHEFDSFKKHVNNKPLELKNINEELIEDIHQYKERKTKEKFEIIQNESEKFSEELQREIEMLRESHNAKLATIKTEFEKRLCSGQSALEEENNGKLDKYQAQLDVEFNIKCKNIVDDHKTNMETLQKNHLEILQDLERDLKSEEELLKKEHATKLSEMRDKLSHELEMEKTRMRETGDDRLFEKLRCEKRLLEDKYRCLKEKYVRLKTDVKLSLERRNRRREQAAAQHQSINTTTTTGSETERSISNKPSIGNSDNKSLSLSTSYPENRGKPPVPPKTHLGAKEAYMREKSLERHSSRKQGITSKYIKHLQVHYQDDTTSVSQSDTTISNNYTKGRYLPVQCSDNGNSDSDAFQNNQENNNNLRDRQRKKLFSRMKSASTSRLNSDNYKGDRPCTPVENLRRQLEKLEDLEDQFPDNTLDATYHLRYPFSDISNDRAGTSSELEFFKHRIHLERDSVRRAKESLRTQRTNFRARQREIKQRHKATTTRHSLDQLIQEEKELTEMEVNLHRTRALLGEKVIRLRHLEQSLQRIYEQEKPMELLHVENKEDATLSDLSSHSSSGFSSTDFASGDTQNLTRRREMYQESSDCIQNLEILNVEIREILDILGKQQSNGTLIPLGPSDLNWPTLPSPNPPPATPNSHMHTPQSIPTLADRLETYRQLATGRVQTSMGGAMLAANTIVSQNPRAVNYTTSLVERTRDLRNWLRQAKNEHDILLSGNITGLSSGGNAGGSGNTSGPQANL